MSCSYFKCRISLILLSMFVAVPLAGALAADPAPKGDSGATQDGVKIEPYTGEPIYLPEPEQVAPPTIISHQTKREPYEDGKTIRIERELAIYSDNSFEADGIYREFYPNGKPFVEGHFREGLQDGEWTYWFENGQQNRKSSFNKGKLNGTWEVFRADGTLAAKRSFKDGQRDGEWINYDDSGKQKVAEEHYAAGKQDGVWKTWHPNGQLKQQAAFKQGKREGTGTEWNDKGEKRAEVNYSDGKLNGTLTRWFDDGRKIVQEYQDGQLKSESKEKK
jgi:antitoxin component YwqK of YwqJK toxin-antitoxin module